MGKPLSDFPRFHFLLKISGISDYFNDYERPSRSCSIFRSSARKNTEQIIFGHFSEQLAPS